MVGKVTLQGRKKRGSENETPCNVFQRKNQINNISINLHQNERITYICKILVDWCGEVLVRTEISKHGA